MAKISILAGYIRRSVNALCGVAGLGRSVRACGNDPPCAGLLTR